MTRCTLAAGAGVCLPYCSECPWDDVTRRQRVGMQRQGGPIPITRRILITLRSLLKWGLLVVVLGVAVGVPYLYRQVDDRVRCHVEALFASHYPDLLVNVRSAEVLEDEGIVVRGLSILEPGTEGPYAELIHVDEVHLACPTDLQHLVQCEIPVSRVVVKRPTLHVTRRADGTWGAARLLPLPRLSTHPAPVTIENGTIEIFDPYRENATTLTLRDVNLTVVPIDAPSTEGDLRKIKVSLSGDHLRRLELEGQLDPRALACDVSGRIEDLAVSPELRDALPAELADKLQVLGALRGLAELDFSVAHHPAGERPPRFEVTGHLSRGRINDPRLPYPLTEMQAMFHLENDGIAIEHLLARSGQASIRVSYRRNGYTDWCPARIDAELRHLDVNRALLEVSGVPEELCREWDKYRPFGQIHADLKLDFDGRTWHPEARIQCLDVSFTHHKFPYRLDKGRGVIELKNDLLTLNLAAYSGNRPVRLAGEVLHPTSAPTGWCEVKGEELPIDQKLYDALRDGARRVLSSLSPQGTVDFVFRSWVDHPGEQPHTHLVVQLNHCSICYDQFPYAVRNIRGTLEERDKVWTFRNLTGTNDTARVTCHGHLRPVAVAPERPAPVPPPAEELPRELVLRFTATDVPLEEELRDALQPNLRRLWNDLKPRGRIDLDDLVVRHVTGQPQASVTFRAEPCGDTASIEPVHFPYRLEKLQGAVVFEDGHVHLQRLRGEHGQARISAGGFCQFQPDGGWLLAFEGISVDRLLVDRELVQAMPSRMKKAFTSLDPKGPVALRGRWELSRGGRLDDPLTSRWDLELTVAGGSIRPGIKLENIHGGLTLQGAFDGRTSHSFGELDLDSVTFEDLQFTQVTGPLWIDEGQALFGAFADRHRNERQQAPPRGEHDKTRRRLRPLSGRIFGGTVYGNGWVTFGETPTFALRATLADADLATIAQELAPGHQHLKGRILASLNLRGEGQSLNTLSGHGAIHLREADLYELPVMIALLKILNLRRPDTNAFDSSDIEYRIAGNHVYLDRIVFNGDAISLEGAGETNFAGDIRLGFHPMLGPEDRRSRLLKGLLGGAGQEFLLIRVTGTVHDPKTEKQVFPTLNQALQQIAGGPREMLPPGSPRSAGLQRRLPHRKDR